MIQDLEPISSIFPSTSITCAMVCIFPNLVFLLGATTSFHVFPLARILPEGSEKSTFQQSSPGSPLFFPLPPLVSCVDRQLSFPHRTLGSQRSLSPILSSLTLFQKPDPMKTVPKWIPLWFDYSLGFFSFRSICSRWYLFLKPVRPAPILFSRGDSGNLTFVCHVLLRQHPFPGVEVFSSFSPRQ